MSSPINGLGSNTLYQGSSTTGTGNRAAAVTAGGQTFAQIAAGLGIVPQTYVVGDTGSAVGTTGGSGADWSQGSTGSTGATGGSGATGPSGIGQTGGATGLSGSTGGASSWVGGGTGSGATDTGATGSSGAAGGAVSGIGAASAVGAMGTTGASGATGATGATGSTGSGTIADLSGTDTFLKLLVAQLKNQDPTSPMDDQAFVTELAQFNTVEQMINLKQAIGTQTTAQQASEGIGLLGRTISYATTAVGSNNTITSQGAVTGVSLTGGQVELQVGTQKVALTAVTGVTA